ncbi:MAG: HAD family hydrolase [Candidatus Nomurabacteria bacterium]|nr:MAG: HAD family hydrolase [Candidatus Nomurabacteria bacterium]
MSQHVIVFDFNRTLYDPAQGALVPGALEVLARLQRRYTLALFSRAIPTRTELIRSLGLASFFSEIVVSRRKSQRELQRIVKGCAIGNSFVIGDRVRKEIALGNRLGLQTVWVRQGKFASELPRSAEEQPTFTVSRLQDILEILP